MRVLVTGANGQVGWELVGRGVQHDFEIIALDRSALDITDQDSVKREVSRSAVSLVVNGAAYTAVDRAESEPEIAFSVNRDGPTHLASACAEAGIPLIHMSTDYVFDGRKRGPYLETDPVSPIGVYGESKAAGEAGVRTYLQEHIILRTAWVYGIHGQNFVKTMLQLGQEHELVRVVADQYGCPTYAADIAETILTIASYLQDGGKIAWGTYHYCGRGVTTWHGFAEAVFAAAGQYVGLTVRKVEPITTAEYPTPASRPANSVLDCSLLEETFGISSKLWRESLFRMLKTLFSVEESKIKN
ncbi:MAG: dTDP-4-dehydrorhamnose reductase [Syntrophobacterales bacterium]|jgi:dTDP-4-dehydrorhamnose reductase